jgi:hypothetical protein
MARRLFAISAALALSACIATAPTPSPVMAQTSPPEPASNSWFYGHPAPTISAAAAFKAWQACIVAAAARLDDHKSSVMDIALAIEPLCDTKEETMIDAINKEFLDKNTGIAANMSMTEMERVRKDAHANFRQNIGTFILALRKPGLPAERPSRATDQEQKDADTALVSCMGANDHDDGISDAATIGRALLSACAREFRNSMRTGGIAMDKLNNADLNKVTKSNLDLATKFVLHQRELLATAKRCIDQAKRIATAAAAAHPELLDSLLKQVDPYIEKVLKDPRSCPPFLTD